ncbi:MAG: hypothetical protein H7330_07625 [Hymenobacteraceae bacterium]|nr:hypothetical protein [Hymenobacteraceae bacterium]
MESQSQNPTSATTPSGAAAPTPQASQPAGKSPSQGARRSESAGTEQVSGLNALESPEQAIGKIKQLGELNSQTGAADKAHAALSSSTTPVKTGEKSATPEWRATLQSTLQQGWTSLSARVRGASSTQLALGAAAVGAAVWLGTRKRGSKTSSREQQTSADRWSDYPKGSDGSRSDSHYGESDTQASYQPTRQDDESRSARTSGIQGSQEGTPRPGSQPGSQTTKGTSSGPYGHSQETWQRPSEERWDD